MSTPETLIPRTEFAARIKQKYPQYKDIDDGELATKVLRKHPKYLDRVEGVGTVEENLAAVEASKAQLDTAQANLLTNIRDDRSPLGHRLNPDVVQTVKRPKLAKTEEGIVSLDTDQALLTPKPGSVAVSVPPTAAAPVSLEPVIQSRLEATKQQKRQQEIQRRVAQARQVRAMSRGEVATAYAQRSDARNAAQEAVNAVQGVVNQKGRVMGDFRKMEERDARVAQEIRPQVVKEFFGMGAGGVRQDIPTEVAERQIAADPNLQQYIELETQRRVQEQGKRAERVSQVERGIAPPLGFADKVRELRDKPEQLIPFLSSIPEFDNLLKAGQAAEKLERGERLTEEEELRLRELVAAGKQDQSLPYQIANTLSALPAFVGEFAATGGIFSAGKKAAVKGLEKIATKKGIEAIEKRLVGRLATKGATSVVGAAAQTLPAGATRIPVGVLYREQEGADFATALQDTLTDQFIEVASERTGGVLSHIPLPKRLSAIRDAITSRWISKAPGRTAAQLKKIVDKTGWHGPLGEVFEERVGDVARYGTGLQASPIPTLEQLAVEGLAFSVPGVALAGANKIGQKLTPAPKHLVDYAINSPLTSESERAELKKLTESGEATQEQVEKILRGEAPDQKPDVRTEKPSKIEAEVPKPQQTAPVPNADVHTEPKVEDLPGIPVETALSEPTQAETEVIQSEVQKLIEEVAPSESTAVEAVEVKNLPSKQATGTVEAAPESVKASAVPENVASVPFMITRKMEADLKNRGYAQKEIDKLTPQRAHEILAKPKTTEPVSTPSVTPEVSPSVREGREYPLAEREDWYTAKKHADSGGRMTTMTPDEFLALDKPIDFSVEGARENVEALKRHFESGGKPLDPLIIYKDGKTDGRHRAVAAKELGIKDVPVLDLSQPSPEVAKPTTPESQPKPKTVPPSEPRTAEVIPLKAATPPAEQTPKEGARQSVPSPSAEKARDHPRLEITSKRGTSTYATATLKDNSQVSMSVRVDGDTIAVSASKKGGTESRVGQAIFVKQSDGKYSAGGLEVEKAEWRKGIATALYDLVEKAGFEIRPSRETDNFGGLAAGMTAAGEAFWQSRRPSATPKTAKASSSTPARLADWGKRLKSIAETKNLADLQSLADEMAEHKDDPKVARLRTVIQAEIARARQPNIPERPSEPEIGDEQQPIDSAEQFTADADAAERGNTKHTDVAARVAGTDWNIATRNQGNHVVRAVNAGEITEADGHRILDAMVKKQSANPGGVALAQDIAESLGIKPQKLSQKAAKLRAEAERPEGKTVRPKPTHRIGAPKSNPEKNSLSEEVRAMGGIKPDADNVGEIRHLKRSGKRGLVNETSGRPASDLALELRTKGYGVGIWDEGKGGTGIDAQAFLQAVIDDAASPKHYSTQYDVIEEDPDVKAWEALTEDDAGKELLERVESGNARASDIFEFVRQAEAYGLSERGIQAFVNGLQGTVQEELHSGTEEAEGYTLDEDGTLLDPDGTPLFSRVFHGSPHTFDKFDMSKVGTGEGAQSYGYGLYFTDKRDIAEYYHKQLAAEQPQRLEIDGIPEMEWARGNRGMLNQRGRREVSLRVPQEKPITVDEIRRELRKDIDRLQPLVEKGETFSGDIGVDRDNLQDAIAGIRFLNEHDIKILPKTKVGAVYEVELTPKDDEYLLWDKPLSEQSEKVLAAIGPNYVKAADALREWERAGGRNNDASWKARSERLDRAFEGLGVAKSLSGQDIYRKLSGQFAKSPGSNKINLGLAERSDQKASDYLHSLGIRGIKYEDNSSRGGNGFETYGRSDLEDAKQFADTLRDRGYSNVTVAQRGDEWFASGYAPKSYNYVIFSDADAEIIQQPQFAHQLGFIDEGLSMQEAPRPKSDQRERLLQAEKEREEAANPERAKALRTLAEIRRRGMTVDEYSRQGALFGDPPSAAEIALLKELESPSKRKTETAQPSMFAKGEAGTKAAEKPEFTATGNAIRLENEAARKLLTRVYGAFGEGRDSLRGAFEPRPSRLIGFLESHAKRNEEDAEVVSRLIDAVRKVAKQSNGVVIGYGEATLRHEKFHQTSSKSRKTLLNRHSNLAQLEADPSFEKAKSKLVSVGYPDSAPELIEETAAHIAEGRYAELGLTREEAIDWMDKWFESFAQKNPNVTPAQFKELSDVAEQALATAYSDARRSGAKVTQSDQDVPRVEEGREGGDRAQLARAGQTDTPEFRRWFGDSKVVDDQGKPLVVYHGTNRSFDTFDTAIRADKGRELEGVYFSPDSKVADFFAGAQGRPRHVVQAYLSLQNPYIGKNPSEAMRDMGVADESELTSALKQRGHDGAIFKEGFSWKGGIATEIIAFEPTQIKSANGNAGTFDPENPNILMAIDDDPWSRLSDLAEEFDRIANEPDLPEGQKPLSLPKTLDAAGLESGPTKGYTPESLAEGVEYGKQTVLEKGIDGAIEFVKTGDGIEWASTGFEVSAQLRAEEARLRAEGKTEEADATQEKRFKFLDDFALASVERGRSIVGIKAVAEFSPDRMAYMLNKVSLKKRKRGISPEEDARIAKLGEELGALEDRNKALEKALDIAKAQASKRAPKGTKPKKSDYQSKLDAQAESVLLTLKPKVGKFDFAQLGRSSEKGALTIGIPPLPGDAELIAQYAASRLATTNTVADLNEHLLSEFGQELAPYLPKIRQRAYGIRQEARLAEIEAQETEPKRRKTILAEIQKEIAESLTAIREAQKAQDQALKAERRLQATEMRAEARTAARQAREAESEAKKQIIKEARADLKRLREEMKAANRAETRGYRETIAAQREAARRAELWDTPLRNEAAEARERLQTATDVTDPQTMADLVSVAAAKFLPDEIGGVPRKAGVEPAKVYRDLKEEFPKLVTKKNQGEIYKRGYQRIQDMTAAAREAARMRSASAESKRLWDELGIDVDAQAVLIKQAEVRRQTDELRKKAVAEFNRVSKTFLERAWMEAQAFPRSLQSSVDAPLGRQGVFFLLTHPILASKSAVPATLRGYGSIHVNDYVRHETDLTKHPKYDLAIRAKLDLSQVSGSGDPSLAGEEQFQSPLASKIFPHVRLSEQGYVLGMNAERLAIFDRLSDLGFAEGYTPEANMDFFEAVAAFVNDGTGRGNMPEFVKRASSLMNFFFFSTRLNISRIQLLNDLFNPVKYLPDRANPLRTVPGFGSYDPVMRKVMAQELLRLAASLTTIYMLAHALGVGLEFDPEDPDALLLRVRNTRYDITGGEAGTIRFLYRFLASIYKTANGEDLSPFEEPLAIAGKFIRYKLAPLPSGTIDALTGKDAVNNPANLTKFESPKQVIQENVIIKRTLPILTGNVIDSVAEEGWIGLPMALPALAGFGVSSRPDRGIRAIKNQKVQDTLEELKINSQSLIGQKTKDDDLDEAIEKRILERVENLKLPEGTDIGKETLIREQLANIRALAKAETALAEPAKFKDYLVNRAGKETFSFLSDDDRAKLTEADVKRYRGLYADAYLTVLKNASKTEHFSTLSDENKVKLLDRAGRIAHNTAKIKMKQK